MLTLQFIPYAEIESLNSHSRIQKVLGVIKDNKIVLMEGRLKKSEEAELIKKTMEEIGENADNDFKGIELSVIQPSLKNKDFFRQLRYRFINMILGDRQGFTVVGPASIVKEIKQDPDKLQLFIENISSGTLSVEDNSTSSDYEENNSKNNGKKKKRSKKHKIGKR
ncbi:MAG: DUF2073 domain-containing protein [Candidatus Woesearchaeota archaeon]